MGRLISHVGGDGVTGETKNRIAHAARWVICVPWSQACGILAILIFNAGSRVIDEDAVPLIGSLLGAVCGGWMAVEMAVAIAPGYARYVAVAAWLLSLSLAVAWISWAHASSSEWWMRANAWFTGTLYVVASSVTAFLFASGRRTKADAERFQKS
jgi:hypothetical protein